MKFNSKEKKMRFIIPILFFCFTGISIYIFDAYIPSLLKFALGLISGILLGNEIFRRKVKVYPNKKDNKSSRNKS